MSERSDRGPSFQIPDLELEPALPSKRAGASAPASGPVSRSAPRGPTRGRELDLEAGPGVTLPGSPGGASGEPALALELVGVGAAGGAGAPSFGLELSGSAFDDDLDSIHSGSKVELAGAVTQESSQRRVEATAWPSGRTRSPEQLPVDPLEITLTADYGAAPTSALLAPLYAYRVYTRRAPLQQALARHHAGLVQAEAERDDALARLASELRSLLEASDTFRRLLEPIREVERLSGDRHAALSQVDSGYREQMGKFDGDLARLGEALAQASAVRAERSALAEARDNELRRADAKLKRVQIEMRGVLDLARQAVGPEGGDMPPAQAAQLAELQTRIKALEPEALQARSEYATAEQALEQAQAEQRRLEAQKRALERQRAQAGGELEKQLSARAAGVTDAEQQRRSALAEVARAVLAARGSVAVPEATLHALREHDRRVEAQAVRVETHVRALDAHDRERVRQGIIVALSTLGVVVLAIVLKAVL